MRRLPALTIKLRSLDQAFFLHQKRLANFTFFQPVFLFPQNFLTQQRLFAQCSNRCELQFSEFHLGSFCLNG